MTTAKTHDIFVGNLAFNTTEEQLRVIFSTVGPVAGVRIVTDKETNKSKGFAFVEFLDASTALSAIRNIDGEELNNRKIRVSTSNNSSLKEHARQIGQVIPENGPARGGGSGQSVEHAVQTMKLHECYDALGESKLSEMKLFICLCVEVCTICYKCVCVCVCPNRGDVAINS